MSRFLWFTVYIQPNLTQSLIWYNKQLYTSASLYIPQCRNLINTDRNNNTDTY